MSSIGQILRARERAGEWLGAMRIGRGFSSPRTFSKAHDPRLWPGMCLPAAYDAIHCEILLGLAPAPGDPELEAVEAYLNSFQHPNGAYRLPGMREEDMYKRDDPAYTREYIDFHATNYAFGALRSLGRREGRRFAFMDPYLERVGLEAWIAKRGWDDPWMEGNSFVNLGSFLIAMAEDGDARARDRLGELLDWLDAAQDPSTGFWGQSFVTRRELLVGMAGAMHTYHLYYYLDRPLGAAEGIAEACISLARAELDGITSACLDVDIVDVLANLHRLGLRRLEIESLLEKKLDDLLSFQSADGGFADEPVRKEQKPLRFDGWVGGYSEPQGLSNCFATWFRCAAIGMCACVLYPETADDWSFRNTVGIGYFRKAEKEKH